VRLNPRVKLTDLYWTAGFIEGEGTFTRCQPQITAGQVQKEPLERLRALFGGSINYHNREGKGQPYWTWVLGAEVAPGLAMTLYAIMSPRRKLQIQDMLQTWKTNQIPFRKRTHCLRGHEFSPENTRLRPLNSNHHWYRRVCIRCSRERALARYYKLKDQGSQIAK
jgi:hypothetical protein